MVCGADRARPATGRAASASGRSELAADAEALDDRAVALDVGLHQVLEQAATLADQQQQAAPAVVVVLVGLEVLGQVGDATGEHRDLDLGAAGVAGLGAVLGDDLLLGGGVERHA